MSVTCVIVLTTALGVSASSTVFCWIQSIVRDPLPVVPESNRLVALAMKSDQGDTLNVSYSDYRDLRQQTESLSGITAFTNRPLSMELASGSKRVWAMLVSDDFFSVLGLAPSLGRFFAAEDQLDTPGGRRVVVVSHDFWMSAFSGDGTIVGKSLRLNHQDYTVVGVAPRDFHGTVGGLSFDLWAPLLQQDVLTGGDGAWIEDRGHRALHTMARLDRGVSIEAAKRELDLIGERLANEHPDENENLSIEAYPLSETPYGAQSVLGQMFGVLLLASFLVLLIVGANLTNILLVRMAERQKEFGVRLALGATRARLVRQVLAEGTVLSVASALLGMVLTYWWSGLLRYLIPISNLPVRLVPRVSIEVLFYALSVSLLLGLLAGLVPALRGSSSTLAEDLKDGARGSSGGPEKQRVRSVLTTAQISLAFVALVGGALLLKSFDRLSKADPGFDVEGVLLVAMTSSGPGQSADEMVQIYQHAAERMRSLPGVRTVSFAEYVPLGFKGGSWEELEVEGYASRVGENMKVYRNLVGEGYFDALGIALSAGRSFTARDDRTQSRVAIVNESFVRRFFAGRQALGRVLHGWGQELTVVGVVRDTKYASVSEEAQPYLYVPFRQFAAADSECVLHIAQSGSGGSLLALAQRELETLGSAATVVWEMPLREYIGASMFKNRLAATLLSLLGLTSLLLAAIGIYGVSSYGVRQRKTELGIRMALGATGGDIVALVVGQAVRMATIGIAVGFALSIFGSRALASLLYGVESLDPVVLVVVGGVLALVALFSSLLPAVRASRIDPAIILRSR